MSRAARAALSFDALRQRFVPLSPMGQEGKGAAIERVVVDHLTARLKEGSQR
ncbi:MAG: hypothetical protein JJT95_06750 [Pararhodobacter sp.]|nr:hypothetical protein [Pararhodobacter sp.]